MKEAECAVMENQGGTGTGTGTGGDRRRRRSGTVPSTSLERSCNLSMVPAMCGPQGWADLPDGLLHSIVSLLGNFPSNLRAFAATCPSWRAAFSSYPSNYFVPLLLLPEVPLCSPRPPPSSNSLIPKRPCYVSDVANQDMYMCCQIPVLANSVLRVGRRTLDSFVLRGAYYGNLILSNKQSCVVVDVFTGVSISPPQLPSYEYPQLQYGIGALTAPLASPNSCLMLNTRTHHFFWRVGSCAWFMYPSQNREMKQIVLFRDQVFGMGKNDNTLFIFHFVPQIRIQEIRVDCEAINKIKLCNKRWLVACGDMLVMVGCTRYFPTSGDTMKAFRLDLSTKPAKWVKLEKLENFAIFISIEEKSQPLCCLNPERWGGRSNCIYCCYDGCYKGCIAFELGDQQGASVESCYTRGPMQPMWVVPSVFC